MTGEPIALRPCPFCGGAATLEEIPPHKHGGLARFMPDHPGSWVIECHTEDCGCGLTRETRDEVIASWNRRTPDAIVVGLEDGIAVKAIEEAIHRRVRDDPDHDPSANSVARAVLIELTALRDAARGAGG